MKRSGLVTACLTLGVLGGAGAVAAAKGSGVAIIADGGIKYSGDVAKALAAYVERFENRVGWTKQVLEDEANAWCAELGWKTKHAFMLLRVAVTGRTATPPLFETMVVLGKEITRRRLRRAAEAIGKAK